MSCKYPTISFNMKMDGPKHMGIADLFSGANKKLSKMCPNSF